MTFLKIARLKFFLGTKKTIRNKDFLAAM